MVVQLRSNTGFAMESPASISIITTSEETKKQLPCRATRCVRIWCSRRTGTTASVAWLPSDCPWQRNGAELNRRERCCSFVRRVDFYSPKKRICPMRRMPSRLSRGHSPLFRED
jgi:hypothetical protein